MFLADTKFQESKSLRGPGLTFSIDVKSNDYIESIAMPAVKKDDSPSRNKKLFLSVFI